MTGARVHQLVAFAAGLAFGAGLIISGMTDPNKVLAFLDVFGAWDASLMFVMASAIAVHALVQLYARRRGAPLYAERFALPARRDIDGKLLLGTGLFGLGWGIGGFCPGPSIVAVVSGNVCVIAFVVAMLAGILASAKLESVLRHGQDN
jgi:hypothetical protein